jgi:hypothetical protein
MQMRRLSTILLAVLDISLIALVVVAWRAGQERVHQPEHPAAHSLALPDLTVLNPGGLPRVDVAAIRDQAVFHNRRLFYEPPPPSQVIPPPDFEFAGSMALPQGTRVAFVKKKADQSSRALHVGDELGGWRVHSIDAVRVVLARDDQRYELKNSTATTAVGLIHEDAGPHMAQSGPRVLGARGPNDPLSSTTRGPSSEARIYRAPPP